MSKNVLCVVVALVFALTALSVVLCGNANTALADGKAQFKVEYHESFYASGKRKTRTCILVNDDGSKLPHGKKVEWREDGSIIAVRWYWKGRFHGIEQTFHQNGQLGASTEYIDGYAHGEHASWHWTGKRHARSWYEYDVLNGPAEFFDDNGVLTKKGCFLNGEADGEWSEYRPDGSVIRKGCYRKGKKIGTWVEYDAKGTEIKRTEHGN